MPLKISFIGDYAMSLKAPNTKYCVTQDSSKRCYASVTLTMKMKH